MRQEIANRRLRKELLETVRDLHLRDVGRKSNGATAGEVVKQVWESMLHSVTNLASRLCSAIKDGWKKIFK